MREALLQQMDRLLKPRTVAVIGASRTPGYGLSILTNIPRYGFTGKLYGVNPRYPDIEGIPCVPSLLDIPEPVDHAIVIVPNRVIPAVLEQAEQKGVGALNIIASGYGEAGESERQAQLSAWAQRTGIRLVGPNCLGSYSVLESLNAMPYRFQNLRPGHWGVVYQSGMMGNSMVAPLLDRGLGINVIITSGNEADLDTADFIRYFVDDPETRVIGCFTEQVRNPEKFIRVCELAADANKPIVMLKIGRTEMSRTAAAAHTGSLVGSDAGFDALAKRLGVIRCVNINEYMETVALMHTPKLPRGDRIASLLVSGGAAGLLSDLGADERLNFPPIPASAAAKIRAVLPEFGTVANPLDITAMGALDPAISGPSLEALAESDAFDIIMYNRGLPSMIDNQSPVIKKIREVADAHPEQLFVTYSLVAGNFRERAQAHIAPVEPVTHLNGVPLIEGGMEYALRATRHLIEYARFQRERHQRANAASERLVPDSAAQSARAIVAAAGSRALTEREGKSILALYGISTTKERLATSASAATAIARDFGYPVVLKIESPEITHKTEAGGVKVGLKSDAEVAEAFDAIMASARRYNPKATLSGVLVQEMVGKGHELILGSTRDPQFGPTVLIGLGGIFVEVLKDTQLRLPPLDAQTATEMIDGLRASAVLRGARGLPPADLAALVDTLRRFAWLAHDLGDVVDEIDVNPLIAFGPGQGVKALDCLIVPRAASAG